MRNALLFALVFGLCTAIVAAEGLSSVSPISDAVLTQDQAEFTFTTQSKTVIQYCSLLLDNEVVKNATYRDVLTGRNIQFSVPVANGNHTWQVKCNSDEGMLDTPVRSFAVQAEKKSDVKIQSNGVFRGSFDHIFDITNTPEQEPIVIDKVAAGDFLQITLLLPPSKLKKELYVKQLTSKNGNPYLWIQDSRADANYYLQLGENQTFNISTSHILIEFTRVERNKAILTAYPLGHAVAAPSAPPEPEVNDPPAESPEPEVVEPEPPAVTPVPAPEEPPKQGFFKRFLSWLSNLFG